MRKRTIFIIGIFSIAIIAWITNYSIGRYAIGKSKETLQQSEILLVKGKPDQASEKLKWLLKYDPNNDKAHFLLGQCYYSQKDYANASNQFENVSKNSEFYENAMLNMAMCYLQVGKTTQAEIAFKKHLADFPDSAPARTELQWLYFNQFRLREAESLLKERLADAKNPYPLLYHLLYMEFKPPIAQESIRLLKQINKAQPGQPSVLMALGYCYWKLGKIDKAKEMIERSRSLDPNRIESILNAADFYLEIGELQKCEELLQPKRKYPPQVQNLLEQDDRWHWMLSRLQFQKKNQAKALEEIQKALKINPSQIKYLQFCGTIKQSMGLHQEAQELFQQAKSLALSHRELYKIVSSGVLDRPTKDVCLQVSQHCENLGKMMQSREWKKVAESLQ